MKTLQAVLKALQNCSGFTNTRITVFSDAPRPDVPGETEQVMEVRHFLRAWCEDHRADLVEASGNLGLRNSIVAGVSELLNANDRAIILEDDIEVSPAFLTYMNEALEQGAERPEIGQVSGYFIPTKRSLKSPGLLRVPACWGWGTWRRAWNHYRDDAAALLKEIDERPGARESFNLDGTYDYYGSLRDNAEGRADTWMVRWHASTFLRNQFTLYPGRSLTRNIGFGEGGTHCGGNMDRTFHRQPLAQKAPAVDWENLSTSESGEFREAMKEFYQWQSRQWSQPSQREIWRARWKRFTGRDWRSSENGK